MARASTTAALLAVSALSAAAVGTALAAVPEGSPVTLSSWSAAIELPYVPPPPRRLAPMPPVPSTDVRTLEPAPVVRTRANAVSVQCPDGASARVRVPQATSTVGPISRLDFPVG